MVAAFELDGQPFTALNGGPQFKFDEAISFQVMCDTPGRGRLLLERADRGRPGRPLRLAEGQIRPVLAGGAVRNPEDDDRPGRRKSARVMNAFMKMKKLDIATLEQAYAGQAA